MLKVLKDYYAAVIVETRSLPNLKSIIERHLKMMDKSRWKLYIFHHLNVASFEDLNAIKININKDINRDSYSRMLAEHSFWNQIPHEKILIFQHDSMLLRRGIEGFLEWDWIGGPSGGGGGHYNGGLSIRSKAKTLEVIRKYRHNGEAEDIYFHRGMKNIGARVAPYEVASKFCCERYFKLGTVGYHGLHHFHSPQNIELIKNQYTRKISLL